MTETNCSQNHRLLDTPFCGSCGARLRERESIEGLLAHVTTTAAGMATQAERVRKYYELEPTSRLVKKAEKWAMWRDALVELIGKSNSNSNSTETGSIWGPDVG